MRFVSRPPLTKIIGCSSLIYRWYAFERTKRRETGQNAFLVYTNNVLRAMYTKFCISVDWKPWDLSASLRLTKIIGCSSLIYRWYAFGRTESHEIYQNAFLFYTKNVLRTIYTTFCISVDRKLRFVGKKGKRNTSVDKKEAPVDKKNQL